MGGAPGTGGSTSLTCEPGRRVDCPCDDGADGWQECQEDGQAWSACECPLPSETGGTGGEVPSSGGSESSGGETSTGGAGTGGEPEGSGGASTGGESSGGSESGGQPGSGGQGTGGATCECTEGPCCDGCNFRPDTFQCANDEARNQTCGTEDADWCAYPGKKWLERDHFDVWCSGASAECDGYEVMDYSGSFSCEGNDVCLGEPGAAYCGSCG